MKIEEVEEKENTSRRFGIDDLSVQTTTYAMVDLSKYLEMCSQLAVAFRFMVGFEDTQGNKEYIEYPDYQYQFVNASNARECYALELERLKAWIQRRETDKGVSYSGEIKVGVDAE